MGGSRTDMDSGTGAMGSGTDATEQPTHSARKGTSAKHGTSRTSGSAGMSGGNSASGTGEKDTSGASSTRGSRNETGVRHCPSSSGAQASRWNGNLTPP
jgi:hypothetical protein